MEPSIAISPGLTVARPRPTVAAVAPAIASACPLQLTCSGVWATPSKAHLRHHPLPLLQC